ncbi:MAG: ABC transporter permease [Elusimicrobia bacterium]|nr:ABC transporter permease [Candidatus Liberimonas magnetica]
MLIYIIRRTLYIFPLLLGITLVSFLIMHLAPGKPIDQMTDLNVKVSAQSKQKLVQLYGLDKPWYIQYFNWLKRFIALDFGNSFKDGRSAILKIAERLPASLLLNLLSLSLIFIVALPVGIYSAVHRNSLFDRVMTVFVFVGFSVPTFWIALLLMIFFGLKLGWLPISGLHSLNYGDLSLINKLLDIASHLALPVFVTAFTSLAGLSMYARSSMLDVIKQDYIKMAYAKGLSKKRIIFSHAARNALLPVITILGLSLPGLIGGGFIFETIFAYPGMGRLGYEAIMARDYPVVMAVGTIAALLTMVGNFLADISYAWVDPRIRYK